MPSSVFTNDRDYRGVRFASIVEIGDTVGESGTKVQEG
jgi:hypothetical protein